MRKDRGRTASLWAPLSRVHARSYGKFRSQAAVCEMEYLLPRQLCKREVIHAAQGTTPNHS